MAAVFATSSESQAGPASKGIGLAQSTRASGPQEPGPDPVLQKRQRQSYNATQTAALRIEAEKEARGEARARNKDIAAKISELCGGRVVTGQDIGNWFRNQKRQRTGPGSNEAP